MAEEYSITRSLFGLDPRSAADMVRQRDARTDSDEAYRMAQLTPAQQATYVASRGGAMAGRGVVDLAGGLMGVDTTPHPVKLAQTTQAIMRQMQQEGMDPNDTIGVRKELARRLSASGFEKEAAMLAQEAGAEELGNQKTRAEIAYKNATAIKNVTDAKNAETPFQQLTKTGKFTPESLATYNASGDVKDLVLHDPDRYMAVETNEGVFLVNKADPKDKVRLGDIKPTARAGEIQTRLDWNSALKSAWDRFGKDGAPADVVIERMKKADPVGFANLMAVGKSAVGADNVMAAFGDSKPLTVEQGNLFDFASAATKGRAIIERKGWGKTRAYPKIDESTLKNVQTELMKNPNAPMLMNVVLNKFGDAETREYLADYFGYLLPILRKDTGAAIAASEWVNYFNTYVPMGNASAEDNASRSERLNHRVLAMDAQLQTDPNLRRRVDKLAELEARASEADKLIAAGRDAQRKGKDAKAAWWATLTPEQKALVKEKAGK